MMSHPVCSVCMSYETDHETDPRTVLLLQTSEGFGSRNTSEASLGFTLIVVYHCRASSFITLFGVRGQSPLPALARLAINVAHEADYTTKRCVSTAPEQKRRGTLAEFPTTLVSACFKTSGKAMREQLALRAQVNWLDG